MLTMLIAVLLVGASGRVGSGNTAVHVAASALTFTADFFAQPSPAMAAY